MRRVTYPRSATIRSTIKSNRTTRPRQTLPSQLIGLSWSFKPGKLINTIPDCNQVKLTDSRALYSSQVVTSPRAGDQVLPVTWGGSA